MGFFEDIDLANAEDLEVTRGVYSMVVTGAEIKAAKEKDWMFGLNLTLTITQGKKKGLTFFEWSRVPIPQNYKELRDNDTPEKLDKNKSYLKKRLLALGVPESRINKLEPEELIDQEVIVELAPSKRDVTELRIISMKPGQLPNEDDEDGPVTAASGMFE